MADKCYEGHGILRVAESRPGLGRGIWWSGLYTDGFARKRAARHLMRGAPGAHSRSLGRPEAGLAGQVEVFTS